MSPNWYLDYPKLEEENKALKAEVALLKETLDFIDDHGRASEAMEIMKAQKKEIERLKAGLVKELDKWDEDLTLKELKNILHVLKE